MREAKFTTEIISTLKKAGHYAYKIGDAPITRDVLAVTRFTPGKPFDIVAGIRGRLVGIETKQIRKWRAFALRDMRPAQIKGLDELVDTGQRAFVFLNVRITNERANRIIIWDWFELRERLAGGSIKAKELRKEPFGVGRKGAFDLSAFVLGLDEPSIADF